MTICLIKIVLKLYFRLTRLQSTFGETFARMFTQYSCHSYDVTTDNWTNFVLTRWFMSTQIRPLLIIRFRVSPPHSCIFIAVVPSRRSKTCVHATGSVH